MVKKGDWIKRNAWWFIVLMNVLFLGSILFMGFASSKLTSDVVKIPCIDITGGSDPDYCSDASLGGGNTTEEMQDAVGSGFTGNLSYNDAGNSYDVNGGNILTWLDSVYTKMSSVWATLGNGTMVTGVTLNNGSYFNTDTFVGNYSSFLTTRDLTINGTFLTSFTETDPKWTANQSLYTLLTTLNNGSYFNSASSDTFVANYSDFLNVKGLVTNGTFYLTTNPSAYTTLPLVWNTLSNSTLALTTTLMNGSFFNSASAGDISSVNTTLDGYIYNGSDSGDVYLRFNETKLNLSTYALLSVLNNGTYFRTNQWNATNISYVLNTALNNGTYVVTNILNNGTYSAVDTDTFVANYSSFLNKVNWANVNNGTIVDVSKVSWLNIGNGTLQTVNATWTALSNGTMISQSILNNGTYIINSILNNGSYFNSAGAGATWAEIGNGTVAFSSILNNGSYFNVAGGSYPYTNVTKANITSTVTTVYNQTIFLTPLTTNKNYTIDCVLNKFTSASTVGTQYNISYSGTVRMFNGEWNTMTTATAPLAKSCVNKDCFIAPTADVVAGAPAYFNGYVETTGAGSLNLTMKAETTGTVTTGAGSYCRLIDVDLGAT